MWAAIAILGFQRAILNDCFRHNIIVAVSIYVSSAGLRINAHMLTVIHGIICGHSLTNNKITCKARKWLLVS